MNECPSIYKYYREVVLQKNPNIDPCAAFISSGVVYYGEEGIIRRHYDRLGRWTRAHVLTISVLDNEEPPPLLVKKKGGKNWVAFLKSGEGYSASSTFLANLFSHARRNQGNYLYH